jgi:uncharacterized protein (DUF697 family)
LRQWEKALTGIVAAPAAVALTAAAVATYGVALIERAFEVFESAIGEVGRAVTQEQDDFRQRERSVDRVDART